MVKKYLRYASFLFALFVSFLVVPSFASAAQPANSLSITAYGATGNDTTDDTTAIVNTITAAKAQGKSVYIPVGTFHHKEFVLDGVSMTGESRTTSILYAFDDVNNMIVVRGSGVTIANLQIKSAMAPARTDVDHPLWIEGTNFTIDNIISDGGNSALVFVYGGSNGKIINSIVKNGRADSIHITRGARNVIVANNMVTNSGDDMVATVSYDPAYIVKNVLIQDNDLQLGVRSRGVGIVGSSDITAQGNKIGPTGCCAGVLIATEPAYSSPPVSNIFVRNNTLTGVADGIQGHGALMISGMNGNIDRVRFDGNTVNNARYEAVKLEGTNTNTALINNTLNDPEGAGINIITGTNVYCIGNTMNGSPASHAKCTDVNNFTVTGSSLTYTSPCPGVVGNCPPTPTPPPPPAGVTTINQVSPANVTAAAGSSFNLTYSWNAVPTSTAHNVFVHFVNSAGAIVIGDDHVPPTPTTQWSGTVSYTRSIFVPGTLPNGTYDILVGLYNSTTGARMTLTPGSGVTDAGSMRYKVGTLIVGTTPPPPSPSSFTVDSPANGSAVSGTVQIKGTAGTQWVNIALYDTSNGGAKVAPDVTPSTGAYSLTLNTTTMTNGSHILAVTAFSVPAGQPGGTSKTINLTLSVNTPTPDTTPPTTPGTPTASNVTSNSLTLNWTASTDNVGVTGYRVERCQNSGCTTFTQIATPTTNSYSDTTLSPLTSYTYRVRSADGAGNTSAYSGTVSATTPALGTVSPLTLTGTVQVIVTLNSPDSGSIYYTTDGTIPTQSSTPYSTPFTVNTGTPVKARAFKSGYNPGPVFDVLTNSTLPSATGLAIGSNIKTTDYLNVRTSASLTAPTLGVQPINATGVIIGGPITANGHTWWQVNYASGPDGWNVQDWMVGI